MTNRFNVVNECNVSAVPPLAFLFATSFFYQDITFYPIHDHLTGLVVRRLPREQKIPGSNPACARIFSGSSHTSDFKIGTPVATLPGTWRYRVSAGTGQPGVGML